jgi:hypothetical protein
MPVLYYAHYRVALGRKGLTEQMSDEQCCKVIDALERLMRLKKPIAIS